MAEKIRCVIICGSPDADISFIKGFVKPDDYVMCADNGYNTAIKAGIKPDIFVGDFDSFSGKLSDDIEVVKLKTHKDDSDSMHCAALAVEKDFNEVALLGADGARLDHTLANLYVLKFLYENNITAYLENEKETVQFLGVGEYTYNKVKGKTFSVFPFSGECCEISYKGKVEYPASFLELVSSEVKGLSNIFLEDNIKVQIHSGNALIVINKVSISNIFD
jgi:thiamine pyrophosphokinase